MTTPYKINSLISKAGKTLGSTKVKTHFIFGWDDLDDEHDVCVVHSKISWKKVIY